MADAVTTQTIQDGERIAVMKFTNISDGGGETDVKKVDVSTLATNASGQACTGVAIERIYYDVDGISVTISWDATANVVAWVLAEHGGYKDFRPVGPITNNSTTGKTGDVLFGTTGAAAGDFYSIILVLRKTYA